MMEDVTLRSLAMLCYASTHYTSYTILVQDVENFVVAIG